jgi:FAD/FMN-containing dehydrogenase
MRYDLPGLKSRLGAIRTDDNPAILKQKSRDFYWYSPLLKRQLEEVIGDLIVTPANEAELVTVLGECHRLGIPVTPRGTGTGNYGQAMPLSGGVVLDLSAMKEVRAISPGRVVAGPGAVLAEIDHETRAKSGQELRLFPSTYHTATLGGFIAGGSGGVGSIRWGGLRDYGNIIRLKVVTMEANPRVLELSGDDILKVAHAYGTNGIITECEVPLATAYPWVDVIIGFEDLRRASEFANALGEQDGLLLKELAVVARPIPNDYFLRHRKFLPPDQHLVMIMVADFATAPLLAFAARWKGANLLMRSDTMSAADRKGLPPVFELAWNHTTLRALRVHPTITYLQVLYPFPNQVELVEKIHARFGEEVLCHLEFVRFDGKVTCFGLPIVKYTSDERLDEIMAIHEGMGAPIFNPHRVTLEEGGMKQTDAAQLAFKREADPQGLLNPGKMIAWEDPNYDFKSGKNFLFKGMGGGLGG